MKSIILSAVALAAPILLLIFVFLAGSGVKNLKHTWIPILMVVIGSILMFLNVFFVNPSRGSQLLVSFDYWRKLIADNHKRELVKYTPYRFARQDASRASLESVYKGHKRYTAVIKVHGTVSQTSFDDDLTQLAVINRRMRAIMLDVSNIRAGDVAIFTENERKVNDYLDALVPMNSSLEKLLNSNALKLFDNDADMVEDLSIDLEQLIARCKSQLKTITNLRDSYSAMMDTQLNNTMRLLTVITVVMTIPTVVAGVFGMNVELPGSGGPTEFWWIIGLTAIAALVATIYLIRRR